MNQIEISEIYQIIGEMQIEKHFIQKQLKLLVEENKDLKDRLEAEDE